MAGGQIFTKIRFEQVLFPKNDKLGWHINSYPVCLSHFPSSGLSVTPGLVSSSRPEEDLGFYLCPAVLILVLEVSSDEISGEISCLKGPSL